MANAVPAVATNMSREAYAYLLGQYLGDGHIVQTARVSVLRIYSDSRYPRIIGECFRAVRSVMPKSRVNVFRRGTRNAVTVQSYSKAWPDLFPQHGPGRKHTRPIQLADWQRDITEEFPEALVRGLVHSDGCRSVNRVGGREYPRYLFSNRSDDIRAIYSEHLDLLGIDWRPMGPYNVSVARRASVAVLERIVGPKR